MARDHSVVGCSSCSTRGGSKEDSSSLTQRSCSIFESSGTFLSGTGCRCQRNVCPTGNVLLQISLISRSTIDILTAPDQARRVLYPAIPTSRGTPVEGRSWLTLFSWPKVRFADGRWTASMRKRRNEGEMNSKPCFRWSIGCAESNTHYDLQIEETRPHLHLYCPFSSHRNAMLSYQQLTLLAVILGIATFLFFKSTHPVNLDEPC
jgi:hypothetical protein